MSFDYQPVDNDYYTDDDRDKNKELAAFGGYPPVAPAAAAAPASPYPPVESISPGSTDDLEARAARPKTAIQDAQPAVESPQPTPAVSRLSKMTAQGAPPVEPLHGWKRALDAMAQLTWPTQQLDNAVRFGPQRSYEKNLGAAEQDVAGETAAETAPAARKQIEDQPAHTEAETKELGNRGDKESAEASALANPQDWKGQPGIVNDKGQPLELNEKTSEYRWGQVTGAKPIRTPTETAAQHEQDMEKIGSQIGFSGDPKKIQAEINGAVASGKITQQQANDYISYRMVKGDQGTKVTVPVEVHAGQEGTDLDKTFTGKEVVVHGADGSRKQMSYGDAKKLGVPLDQMTILNANEAQQNRDKDASITATMSQLRNYRNDFKTIAPKLSPDDRKAMMVLTSHKEQLGSNLAEGLQSGLLDTMLGQPLTGYSEKLMNGVMTKDQYDRLSPEGKKLIAGYFNTVVSNFANMKAMLGSVGRNPMQLQAEINRIPLPYLDWQSADNLFNNTRDDIRLRAGSLPAMH